MRAWPKLSNALGGEDVHTTHSSCDIEDIDTAVGMDTAIDRVSRQY
jgi:hypothetical protein